jgi:Photosynthesis system II assembly factor YCF48
MVASNRNKKSEFAGNLPARSIFVSPTPNAPGSVPAAVEAVGTVPVPSSNSTAGENLMARVDAPAIEKAKPPLKDSETANESLKTELQKAMVSTPRAPAASQANGGMAALRVPAPAATTSKQSANWTIAAGVLQRSLDNGRSWQTAARADHALLCYATRGNEVWAGGEAGALLHSANGGTTWSAVAVSFGGHPLSSDVTRIDLKNPAEIVLVTGNGETWSSADSGKTWEKK